MKKLYISAILIAGFLLSSMQAPQAVIPTQAYPTGLKILIYYDDNDAYSTDYAGFVANYTAAGNNVTVVTQSTWNFTKNSAELATFDAVLMSQWGAGNNAFNETTNIQVQSIVSWLNAGDHMLWVAGDSDFAGDWIANRTNPLLAATGTRFRLDAGAIADSESNDQASYRTVANETGVSSPMTDFVTAGFKVMPFHGPTSVNYWDGSKYWDLRNATLLAGENILVNSSAAATALDQDTAVGPDDFYAYSTVSGNYPMLVADTGAVTNSVIVVSGERIFSDYKNMYGDSLEKDQTHHNGSTVVDRLMDYFFVQYASGPQVSEIYIHNRVNTVTATATVTSNVNVTQTEQVPTTVNNEVTVTSTSKQSAPLNMWASVFALGVVAFAITKKKKFTK